MTTDWYKIDCNGVEIARGTWAEITDVLQAHIARAMQPGDKGPRGFTISIRKAQSQYPPQRGVKLAGQARELQIEHELARMHDDGFTGATQRRDQ